MSGIYEVTLRQRLAGQQVINRFAYVQTDDLATPTSFELLSLMGFIPAGDPPAYPEDTLFEAIRGIQSEGVSYLEVEARELYTDTDFYVAPFIAATTGLIELPSTSPVLAFGLFSDRLKLSVRRGFKRFAGVTEEGIAAEGVLESTMLGFVSAVGEKMGEPLSAGVGVGGQYSPAVLSFEEYETPSGKKARRPYATEAEQRTHAAWPVSWFAYDRVRSQTSRQVGRGA